MNNSPQSQRADPLPLVTFALITRNRSRNLAETIESLLRQRWPRKEVVVVDNDSVDDTGALFATRFVGPIFRYIRAPRNLGVSGGRNVAIEAASGEFVFTIDDDAVLQDPDCVHRAVQRFQEAPQVGILAFRIVNYFTGKTEQGAFPNKNKRLPHTAEFETTWFIGAGHMVRREVYRAVGSYNEYFPYGHEELDFALRTADAGYRILYFPAVCVHHKKTDTGQRNAFRDTRFQAVQLHNRIKVAIRNLPWLYVLTTDLMRSATEALLAEAGEHVDVLVTGDDLGSQNAPLLSPAMYRKLIKPYHAELFSAIKARSKARIFYHSDGNVYPLLNDLIEVGIDLLNPVQVSARDMGDTARLKREFGGRLAFCGGIDSQWVLPHGTPADVRREVRRRIKDLAPGGGYILASVHCIQPDVPVENLCAMFEEAVVAGRYPLAL